MESITYDDFKKLKIVIGKIIEAEKVPDADKLLKLIVDIGTEKRQIVSGIAAWYFPEDLIGKQIPVLINLEPRKFRGVESQGMILAADFNESAVLLHPGKEVLNGSEVL